MKRILIALACLSIAAGVPSQKTLVFKWSVNPADLGGLSTNDYYTNIVFNLLSVTNCTIPTNQWPVIATLSASSFPSTDGVNWTNTVIVDSLTRFYMIQVVNLNGGVSPFSSVATWIPTPPVGYQPRILGP